MRRIKVGTRASKLALYQADLVCSTLSRIFKDLRFDIVKIKTVGDRTQTGPVKLIGPGIFTREIESALINSETDIAVHSAKDLASELPSGLVIGAVLEREDPRDCFVGREGKALAQMPEGARIGTSSLRRTAQLRKIRPDLNFLELRGNVDTRIKKIQQGVCEGMILALAGLKRLGLDKAVSEVFEPERFLPQAGQGAIAVELRAEDGELRPFIEKIIHRPSFFAVSAERGFLKTLQGGCQLPAGSFAQVVGDEVKLKGAIFQLDGKREVSGVERGKTAEAEAVGKKLAERLLKSGGAEILKAQLSF
jgi:hydroxymethylbilane synthase